MKDYFDVYKDYADKYLKVNLKRLIDKEAILGTDCKLYKNKENPYDELFGPAVTTLDRSSPIDVRLIVNKNTLMNPFNHQLDSVVVYTSSPHVDIGDVIEYTTREELIAYKVEFFEEYSVDSHLIKRVTLSGYRNSK